MIIEIEGLKIKYCEGVYWPEEDTFFFLDVIKDFISRVRLDFVVDLGCGVGILSLFLAKHNVTRILAIDINPKACYCTKHNAIINKLDEKIDIVCCDLLSPFRRDMKASLIVFNPPYLPGEFIESPDIYGGREGVEVVLRFIKHFIALRFLRKSLLLLSSLGNLKKFFALIEKLKIKYKIIKKKYVGLFEELIIVLLEKFN